MKINMNIPVLTLDGNPMKNENGSEVTVKGLVVNAVLGIFRGEENLSGEEKITRWKLATAIHKAEEEVALTPEDIVLIKKLVALMYGPNVVGPIWMMFE